MTVLLILIGLLFLRLAAQWGLSGLNLLNFQRAGGTLPDEVKPFMDQDTFAKSIDYSRAKEKFSMFEDMVSALLLSVVLLSGILAMGWQLLIGSPPNTSLDQAFAIFAMLWILSVFSWPLEYYQQFHLEERFGFNTTTLKTWWIDRLKGLALVVILGLPLLWLVLFIVEKTGPWWWLWAWFTVVAFQIAMTFLAPKFILPLFNKLTPLPDGKLRDSLFELAKKTRFQADEILVMDGSRRSRHANAFFTGFGRFRKIVLFDTLMEELEDEEIEAVLAHEIGHARLGHIPWMLAFSFFSLLLGLFMIDFLAKTDWFLDAFGFQQGTMGPVFLLVMLVGGLVTFWITPLSNLISRKFEYQADAFAARTLGTPKTMQSALKKLSQQNLSNPIPHPLYSAFYYSHPTLIERNKALSGQESTDPVPNL